MRQMRLLHKGMPRIRAEGILKIKEESLDMLVTDTREGVCALIPRIKHGSLVLGYFDGVHLGHRALISRAAEEARGGTVTVRMFSSLPKGEALTTLDDKLSLLEECGVGAVILDDFSVMHSLSGSEFFDEAVLPLSPSCVVCGYNYRYGAGASSGAAELSASAAEHGIKCAVVPEFDMDGEAVSSSRIRALIGSGEIGGAARLLGRYYSVKSTVLHGHALGRTLGFPTVNQRKPGVLLPCPGVYSCTAEYDRGSGVEVHGGVCSIGSRPTVNSDESDVTLETYIFSCRADLYSRDVRVTFIERLRGNMKFGGVDELRGQVELDKKSAAESLRAHGFAQSVYSDRISDEVAGDDSKK